MAMFKGRIRDFRSFSSKLYNGILLIVYLLIRFIITIGEIPRRILLIPVLLTRLFYRLLVQLGMHIEKLTKSLVSRISGFKLPAVHPPPLRIPHINTPTLHLPHISILRWFVPLSGIKAVLDRYILSKFICEWYIHVPRLHFPKIKLPKIVLKLPRFPQIRIRIPRIKFPSFPRIFQPKTIVVPAAPHVRKRTFLKRIFMKIRYFFFGASVTALILFTYQSYVFVKNLPSPLNIGRSNFPLSTHIYD